MGGRGRRGGWELGEGRREEVGGKSKGVVFWGGRGREGGGERGGERQRFVQAKPLSANTSTC